VIICVKNGSTLFLALLLGLSMVSCRDPGVCGPARGLDDFTGDFIPLVDNELWYEVEGDVAPIGLERPEDALCPLGSWYPEEGSLEVDTGLCSWLTVSQPAQTGLSCGDELAIIAWHTALSSAEPGDGYAALFVGDKLLWEERVSIPSEAQIYDDSWGAEFTVEPGEPIYLHVHNHGANVWNFFSLERRSY